MIRSLLLVVLLTAVAQAAQESTFPFVLPWDDSSPGITNISGWLEKPAGKNGFVSTRDGHLFTGDRRFRIFGVNTCFGANFPTHADADKIAARMAKFGINCVRFHHMDMFPAPGGILAKDMKTLDPGQLDKLDYFIAKLKEHGIYVDLNLHVSRAYPGMPTWEDAPSFFKGVDHFYPPMIEMQRDYARQLLAHVNPYTTLAYVDEAAVALVEINNENGLIDEWWNGTLDAMSDVYRDELNRLWNVWLKKQYMDTGKLKAAWNGGAVPLGAEMLPGDKGWILERHQGAKAIMESPLTVQIQERAAEGWHIQLSRGGVEYDPVKSYTVSFRARADKPRKVSVSAGQSNSPWKTAWSTQMKLSGSWREFRFSFQPGPGMEKGRLVFSGLGLEAGTVSIENVSLRPGGTDGLRETEEMGNISFFRKSEFGSRTEAARRDWITFLWDTEEGYWTGMADFIRKELKSRSLLVGTALGFSPPTLQARMDVVDSHSYWQHPHFPRKPWDADDWIVNNIPMTGVDSGNILTRLALQRVKGKPYIVTEYNSSAPNTYSGETFLLLGAYAALQDWDGIFAFAYSHRGNEWDLQRIPSFFDIDQHPVKMATLPAAIALFMREDVSAARQSIEKIMTRDESITKTLALGPNWDLRSFGASSQAPLRVRTAMGEGIASSPALAREKETSIVPSDTGELTWNTIDQRMIINTPRSKAVIGKHQPGPVVLGNVTIEPKAALQNWSTITVTCMEGTGMDAKGKLLITATGWAENTGMQWKDVKKNSVGKNWGQAPSVAEGISARITLPLPPSRMEIWALDAKGQQTKQVPLKPEGTGSAVEISPEYRTLWYRVDIE